MADAGKSRGSQALKRWRGPDLLQAQAADLLDLDPASYNRFENGVRKPAADVMFRIERLTNGIVEAKAWFEPPDPEVDEDEDEAPVEKSKRSATTRKPKVAKAS